jgi:CheY-like chemotaxis protein
MPLKRHSIHYPVLFGKRKFEDSDTSTSLRILIAEDNQINQRVLKHLLGKMHFNDVAVVENGREAVENVERNDYDVLFMDLLMPEMGGIEATKKISSMDWGTRKKPIIIAISASMSPSDRVICQQAGMDFCLSKPTKFDQVHQVMTEIQLTKKLKRDLTMITPTTSAISKLAGESASML